jgi:hypothetical protein
MDGPRGLSSLDAVVQPLVALPEGFDAGLTVPPLGSEPAELGETSPHLAAWWRAGRRMAGLLHRLPGLPLPGCEEDLTGHCGRGTARHGDLGDTPGHAPVYGQGMQDPLRRLPTPRCHLPPWLAPPDKALSVPPPALPRPSQASPGASRHGATREPPRPPPAPRPGAGGAPGPRPR